MSITSRSINACVGAMVADAAAQSTHWIYTKPVADLFGGRPEFAAKDAVKYGGKDESDTEPGFKGVGYWAHPTRAIGQTTQNGASALTVLQSVGKAAADFDTSAHAARLVELIEGDAYDGYVDSSMKAALANIKAGVSPTGSEKEEMTALASATPALALYAGALADEGEYLARAERVTRVYQNNDVSVKFNAALFGLLRAVIRDGKSAKEAVLAAADEAKDGDVAAAFGDAKAAADAGTGVPEATDKFGKACGITGGFRSIVLTALVARNYEDAVRTAILAGGDSATRAIFLGALFAAQDDAVPEAWESKAADAPEARRLAKAAL